ncbi:MAG: calcium-binding protein [Selenomonadaceae bacterium]|nr:calcium-binding protein [Selenomonadaceae bacterium]
MKKFFNLQLFATKVYLDNIKDYEGYYANEKANRIIYATSGNDYVTTDHYYGSVRYTHNNVTVYGGKGSDTLGGSGKNLKLFGEAGEDSLYSDLATNITMMGGADKDILHASRNQKIYMTGDAGNDDMSAVSNQNITLSGGAGNDFINVSGSQNVSIVGGAGKDEIYFGAGGDYKSKNIIVSAGDGNDSINGGGVTDNATITAGKGNDSIYIAEFYSKNNLIKYASGDGNDIIFGFDSNDTLQITSGKFSTLKSGTDFIVKVGKQKIILKDAVNSKYDKIHIKNSLGKVAVYNNWTTKKGTSDRDIFDNTANKVKIALANGDDNLGNSGDQVSISGGNGDDIIINYGNKTTLVGGAGADNISNYGDNVKISGGKGNDVISTHDGDKVSVSGGEGNDYISASYETLTKETTTITGGTGNDTINLFGSSYTKYTVQYNAGDGNDTIEGFNENCTLIIDGVVRTDFYTEKNRYGDFTLKVGKGSIFFKGGVAKLAESSSSNASELWFAEENNFVTSDNLSEITENNLVPTALEKISSTNFENLTTENNFVTFSEK